MASDQVGRPRCRKVKEFSWSLWLSQRLLLYDVEVNLLKNKIKKRVKNHSKTLILINCYCQHTTECICQCTKVLLWQTCVVRDKHGFVMTKYIFCCDKNMLATINICCHKHVFVATKVLSWQKYFVTTNGIFFATKLFTTSKLLLRQKTGFVKRAHKRRTDIKQRRLEVVWGEIGQKETGF